jgi:tRNA nucleotidyltransferase/poly(A) polymerase
VPTTFKTATKTPVLRRAERSEVDRGVYEVEMEVDPEVARLLRDIADTTTPYIVGGSVRDFLMGKEIYDYDVAVRDFDEVVEWLKSLGYDVSEEARSFRVVKVFLDSGGHVDVAGFRSEEYDLVSRKPRVAPAQTIEEDLARRDFTINAMAVEVREIADGRVRGVLIDPFGGMRDLERGVIRAVRSPVARFMEDPLRILRAIRFAVKLGFEIDPETLEAIEELHGELRRISPERVREELEKMLLADPAEVVRLIYETGVWRTIMPWLGDMVAVRHDYRFHHHGETVLEHTVETLENLKKLHRLTVHNVLAVLLHDAGKPRVARRVGEKVTFIGHAVESAKIAEEWLRRLRYDNRTVHLVTTAVRVHEMIHQARGNRGALARIWVEEVNEDPEAMELAIQVAEADRGERYDDVRRVIEEFKKIPRPRGELVLHLSPEKRRAVLRKLRIIQLRDNIADAEELKKVLRGLLVAQ